jgi:hypothetical protein
MQATALSPTKSARSKNRAPQDWFEGVLNILSAIDFRPDDISYPPVQPVQALTTLPKIRSHQPATSGFRHLISEKGLSREHGNREVV